MKQPAVRNQCLTDPHRMRDVDVRETEISTQRPEQQSTGERADREIRAAIHMCASLFKVAVRKFGGGSLGQKERGER